MRKKITLLALTIIPLAAIYWLSGYGFIEITVTPGGQDSVAYQLLNQGGEKTVSFTAGQKVKKMVRRGSYEVSVRRGDSSYFTVTKAGGWFKKTTVAASPQPEKRRKFIGNSPGPCMFLVRSILASASCNDYFHNLQAHLPATEAQPTFTRTSASDAVGIVGGIIKLAGSHWAYLYTPDADEAGNTEHTLYQIDENLNLSSGVLLSGLGSERLYNMQPYKDGFIIYDENFYQVLYWASPGATPVAISLKKPEGRDLLPYLLSAQGQSLVAIYSNAFESEKASLDEPEHTTKGSQSLVAIHDGQSEKQFTFNKHVALARLCGQNRLCVLAGNAMEVYDISASSPKRLLDISGVKTFESFSPTDLLIIRAGEILSFNVEARAGSNEYSLGDYEFCGIGYSQGSYALCLINSRRQVVALQIERGLANNDSIDKKISQLIALPEIGDVSIYGNFIYISPAEGELIYDEAVNGYIPDPALESAANAKIAQAIEDMKFDKNFYRIINVAAD